VTDERGESSPVLLATDAWKSEFPGAVVGALVMRAVSNPGQSAKLEVEKRRLEEQLRAASDRLSADRVGQPYVDYFRARGDTYLVKAQRESVGLKGKPIPSRAALIEAMFMAELDNLILTAGHDLDAIVPPVRVGVTADDDRYVLINGTEAVLKDGDMMMADGLGVVSSVLRGPDRRTWITPETTNVLFAAYAPAGVGEDAVRDHLEDVQTNVRLVAPEARTRELTTLTAS
jgi:DNA/RNA-binding domain of Phe-tRNA-synthetase-like protein